MKKLIVFVVLAIALIPSHSAFAKTRLVLRNACSAHPSVKIEIRSIQGLIVTSSALGLSEEVQYTVDQAFTPKTIVIIYPDGSYAQHQEELAGIHPNPTYVFISVFWKYPEKACYPSTVEWYPRW